MNIERTECDGVLVITPKVFTDARGSLFEAWHEERYVAAGIYRRFVQDNITMSTRGVIRGLHLQRAPHAQAKLITVPFGSIVDVIVDLRPGSPTCNRVFTFKLSDTNRKQLWIPEGFAHGFQVTSDSALVSYKCTAPHIPSHELNVNPFDPALAINWPILPAVLSEKDARAESLAEAQGIGPPYGQISGRLGIYRKRSDS